MIKKLAKYILKDELKVLQRKIMELTLENKGLKDYMEASNGTSC